MSVDAYVDDVGRQVAAVDGFVAPEPLSHLDGVVFTGSGDSLAAAMLAEAVSDYAVRAIDPLEICRNPRIAHGHRLYVVSVSGRTAANVYLARNHPVIAITANPRSALAEAADSVICMGFPNSDVLTAGSISFLNSALVCMSLVRPIHVRNASLLYERARRDVDGVDAGGRVFFVGTQYTYPVAVYAAAKMYEILGCDAHYCRLEQFSHMELFSVRPGDSVILFADRDGYTDKLAASARSQGLRCVITDANMDVVSSILYHTFYAQLLPLNAATGSEVHFMRDDDTRGISDSMIY